MVARTASAPADDISAMPPVIVYDELAIVCLNSVTAFYLFSSRWDHLQKLQRATSPLPRIICHFRILCADLPHQLEESLLHVEIGMHVGFDEWAAKIFG